MQSISFPLLKEMISIIQYDSVNISIRWNRVSLQQKHLITPVVIHIQEMHKYYNI